MADDNNSKKSEAGMKRLTRMFRVLQSEDGMVLVVSLLLLLVATVIGITALSTSTTNVMVAGNRRLSELNFSSADSGIYVGEKLVDEGAFYGSMDQRYNSIVRDPYLFSPTEDINDDPISTPDIRFTAGGGEYVSTISIDTDYLYGTYAQGCAIEFASGYEGVGKGAGGGGCGHIYYAITSVSQGPIGSEARVCAVYRYVK
ncbi:MAG: hypothetical protein Fur0020_12400 [Thermodesulfovibrionia bacterium]